MPTRSKSGNNSHKERKIIKYQNSATFFTRQTYSLKPPAFFNYATSTLDTTQDKSLNILYSLKHFKSNLHELCSCDKR